MDTRWIALASLLIFAPACGEDGGDEGGTGMEDGSSTGEASEDDESTGEPSVACPRFDSVIRGALLDTESDPEATEGPLARERLTGEIVIGYTDSAVCSAVVSTNGLDLHSPGQAIEDVFADVVVQPDGSFSAAIPAADEQGADWSWTFSGVISDDAAEGVWTAEQDFTLYGGTWSAAAE